MLGGVMFTSLADSTDTAVAWMGGITGLVFLLIGLFLLVLVIAAVISALVDGDTTGGGKLLWIIFIVWFPLFGAVAWFVVGKKGHLNRFLGIDKGRARHTVPSSVGQHSNVANGRNGGSGGAQAHPGEDRPGTDEDRPVTPEERHGADEDRSGAREARPGTDEDRLRMREVRPVAGDERLGMRVSRPRMGYGGPAIGHSQPEMGHA
ncbi:hypothetical protein GCM10009602_58190 [Nocardiopsis tropica]